MTKAEQLHEKYLWYVQEIKKNGPTKELMKGKLDAQAAYQAEMRSPSPVVELPPAVPVFPAAIPAAAPEPEPAPARRRWRRKAEK